MPDAPPAAMPMNRRFPLLVLLFAGFVLIGVPTVIVGPILPTFISRWSLNDSQAGLFFTVQFAASLAGVWLTTALTAWRGYRPGLVIGYILTGIGLASLNAPTRALALTATAAFGLGYGFVTPPTNLSAAEAGGKNSAGLVSLLNFAWGIGAVACSPLIMFALRRGFLPTLLLSLGVAACALAASFLFVSFPSDRKSGAADGAIGATGQNAAAIPALGITVAVTALFFLYVGTEASIGGWAAEHTKRLARHPNALSTIAPMFFYGGIMAGRAAAIWILARIREIRVITGALMLAIVGVTALIAAPSQIVAVCGLGVAGLGAASIYPLYISWFSRWYGNVARKLGGLVFSMASLGGSALPWLVGGLSMSAASLRIGLLVPLAACLVMASLVTVVHRRGLV
jgi:FHS family glucose/mannose:H+ symporter-like MFS transporter